MPEIVPNWHPLLVHFAIAPTLLAVFLFFAARALAPRPAAAALTVAARVNLVIGALGASAAIASGLYAAWTVGHDDAAHANLLVHQSWAYGTAAVLAATVIAAWFDRRRAFGGGAVTSLLLVAAAIGIAGTGWYGGENVYRHGLGVQRLPDAGSHHHGGHDHGDEAAPHSHGDEAPAHDHGTPVAANAPAPSSDAAKQADGLACDTPGIRERVENFVRTDMDRRVAHLSAHRAGQGEDKAAATDRQIADARASKFGFDAFAGRAVGDVPACRATVRVTYPDGRNEQRTIDYRVDGGGAVVRVGAAPDEHGH